MYHNQPPQIIGQVEKEWGTHYMKKTNDKNKISVFLLIKVCLSKEVVAIICAQVL